MGGGEKGLGGGLVREIGDEGHHGADVGANAKDDGQDRQGKRLTGGGPRSGIVAQG